MAKKDKDQEVTQENVQPEEPKVDIIRGRMPVAIVAAIRFGEKETATAAVAAKYRTTVGKVDDIRKDRNFGYVTEDFKPTEEQLADAKKYSEQLMGDNPASVDAILDGMGLADDGGAAFEEARKAARKTKAPAASAEAGEQVEADEVSEEDIDELTQ